MIKIIQNHPAIWLISLFISTIASTTAVNWFLFEKIISENFQLKLQEKQNKLGEKETQIDYLIQKVEILTNYKTETEGNIQNIINKNVEPYKSELLMLKENMVKQKDIFTEKENELNNKLYKSNLTIETLNANIDSLINKLFKLEDQLSGIEELGYALDSTTHYL